MGRNGAENASYWDGAEEVMVSSNYSLLAERGPSAVGGERIEEGQVRSRDCSEKPEAIMADILERPEFFYPKDISINDSVHVWCEGELPAGALSEHIRLSRSAYNKLFGVKRRVSISESAFLSTLKESFEIARANRAFESQENDLSWLMRLTEGQMNYSYRMSLRKNDTRESDSCPIALFVSVPEVKPVDGFRPPEGSDAETVPRSAASNENEDKDCTSALPEQVPANDVPTATAEKPGIPASLISYSGCEGLIPRGCGASWAKELALASRASGHGTLNDEWGGNYEYLQRYLIYTYDRLRETNLVAVYKRDRSPLVYENPDAVEMDDCWFLAFNTGLQDPVSKGYLYACFDKTSADSDWWNQDGFRSIGPMDDEGGMLWTHILSARYIGQADYFDNTSSTQIRYKGQDVKLLQDFYHHAHKRIARFPVQWVCEHLGALAHANDVDRAKACFRDAARLERDMKNVGPHGGQLEETKRVVSEKTAEMYKALGPAGEGEFKELISTTLRDATKEALEQVRRNPNRIDFWFYPEGANIEKEDEPMNRHVTAALPLCIPPVGNATQSGCEYSLVLLAIPYPNRRKAYSAKTVLTVEQAYWSMRLVGRPESGWLCDVGLANGFLSRTGDPMGTVEVDSDGNPIVPYYIDAWIEVKGRPVWLKDGCLIGRGWDTNGQDDVDRFLDYPHLSRRQGCFERGAGGWCFYRDEQSKGATVVLKADAGTEVSVGKGERIDLNNGD